jgi:hypothetical protein
MREPRIFEGVAMHMHDNSTIPTLVVGRVTQYLPARKFGFAQGYDFRDPDTGIPHRIFLHADGCRQMGGKASSPELTNARIPVPASWDDPSFLSGTEVRLTMHVIHTTKGCKAVAWGIHPKRTIYTDLNEAGGLGSFVGGRLSIFGLAGVGCWDIGGTIVEAQLQHGAFVFELVDGSESGRSFEQRYLRITSLWDASATAPADGRYVLNYCETRSGRTLRNVMTLTKPVS